MVTSPEELKAQLAIFTGPPGTGKSTLADEIARDLGAPNIGWDWLVAGLAPFPSIQHALEGMEREEYREVGYSLMTQVVEKQLRNRQSVVLDCVVRGTVIDRWHALAGQYAATVRVIECICSDVAVHESRVVGRARDIPGWHELKWEWVLVSRDNYEPLTCEKLVLDAVDPFADNLARVRQYIGDQR